MYHSDGAARSNFTNHKDSALDISIFQYSGPPSKPKQIQLTGFARRSDVIILGKLNGNSKAAATNTRAQLSDSIITPSPNTAIRRPREREISARRHLQPRVTRW